CQRSILYHPRAGTPSILKIIGWVCGSVNLFRIATNCSDCYSELAAHSRSLIKASLYCTQRIGKVNLVRQAVYGLDSCLRYVSCVRTTHSNTFHSSTHSYSKLTSPCNGSEER
ncbi:hypothetical protein GCK32_010281, partial [Trichostrongylus colubriformis]